MNVSVIIPVLNEAAGIASAVRRARDAGATEVIVCDGGSDDGSQTIAEAEPCQLVTSPPGRARQQNRGAAEATGDVFLFLHADCWLEPGSIAQIVEALADPSVVVGAFLQTIDAAGTAYRLLETGNAARVRWLGMAYGDQGIFVRRARFQSLGGFPDVPLMEDLRLMRALRKQSRPILLPGPLHVSARRWQKTGVIRQTLRNWSLLAAERCGASPERLTRYYPPAR